MVVCVPYLVAFIENGGIEYKIRMLVDKPLYVSVRKLGGITFRFARDGFYTEFVDVVT